MKRIVYFFIAFSFFFSISNVSANNIELKLKKIDGVKLESKDGKYDSAQGMTITNKYIVIVLASSDSSVNKNVIYVYDKNSYKFVMRKEIESCSHANGITYNKDNNTLVCADAHNKRFVVYDATNFSFKKFIYTNQPYNNIDYDSSRKNYWVVIDSNFAPKWYKIVRFDENFNRIIGGDITYDTLESYNLESSLKYRLNQDIVYKDNRLYLINYVNKENLHFYKQAFSNVQLYDGIIFSYDVRTGKKGNLIYNHPIGEINELEDVAFDGDTPYFLYQRGGRFQLYTAAYTPRNVNAKVKAIVNTNNSALLKDLHINANFVSTSKNFSLNKKVEYNNGYTVSNIPISKAGKYELKITQDNIKKDNWTFDKKVMYATIKVKYDLNINNLNYSVSFKNQDHAFTNTYIYPKINIPLEILAPIAYISNNGSYNLNLKATLYQNNNKIAQVERKNGKYLFNNLNFSKPGVYTYTIKQDNSGTKKDGIYTSIIDNSTLKVKITVTADKEQLKYKVEFDGKKTFNNKVSVAYNTVNNNYEIVINSKKSNPNLTIPMTKLKIYKGNTLFKTISSNNNKYTFNIPISSPGTYKYKLMQENINDMGIYKYNLDNSEIYLEIVAKVVNNKIVCTSTLTKNAFNNRISAVYPELNVPISLKINSNVFGNIAVPTTKAKIYGSSLYDEIESNNGYYNYNVKIKKEGTYTYTIVQNNINNSDYQYNIDNNKILVTIKANIVNDQLNYIINYSKHSFDNSYKEYDPLNLKFAIPINTIKNEINADSPLLTANLYDSNNAIIGTSNSNNLYVFEGVTVTSPGTYTYHIKQSNNINNSQDNISYVIDNKDIIVKVVVTDNNGSLKAHISYSHDSFNNTMNVTYQEKMVLLQFDVNNIVNNSEIDDSLLTASIYSDDGEIKIATTTINNGKYSFNLPISKPGDYVYVIRQDNAGTNESKKNITTLDDDIKKITIHTSYENNNLNSYIDYNLNSQSFTNYFQKKEETLNIPITINIQNQIKSDKIVIPETTAVISELTEDGTFEEIESVNSNNNNYGFHSINLSDEGIYIYKVIQNQSGHYQNQIYNSYISDEEKDIVIKVSRDTDGNLTYNIEGDRTPFNNKYEIKYDPITIPLTINISDNNISLWNSLPNRIIISDNTQVLDSMVINSSTLISDKIKVDKEGEYVFNIYQTKPHNYFSNNFEHSLDSKIIKATVLVTANENSQLSYEIRYDEDSIIKTFYNTHNMVENNQNDIINIPISVDIFTNSNRLDDLDTKATIFEDGLPIETSINSDNQYSFASINVATPGLYKYSIKQVPIDSEEFDIDDEIINVNIEVYIDDAGTLQYRIEYENNISSFTNEDLTIVNDEDDLSVATNDENVILDNVPSTSLFHGKSLIIGFFLICFGYIMVKVYKEKIKLNNIKMRNKSSKK